MLSSQPIPRPPPSRDKWKTESPSLRRAAAARPPTELTTPRSPEPTLQSDGDLEAERHRTRPSLVFTVITTTTTTRTHTNTDLYYILDRTTTSTNTHHRSEHLPTHSIIWHSLRPLRASLHNLPSPLPPPSSSSSSLLAVTSTSTGATTTTTTTTTDVHVCNSVSGQARSGRGSQVVCRVKEVVARWTPRLCSCQVHLHYSLCACRHSSRSTGTTSSHSRLPTSCLPTGWWFHDGELLQLHATPKPSNPSPNSPPFPSLHSSSLHYHLPELLPY